MTMSPASSGAPPCTSVPGRRPSAPPTPAHTTTSALALASSFSRAALSAVAAAALWCGGPAARATDDDTQRAQLEQKIRLTARLIADSPTAQRIGSSGNPHAVAHFDEGRVHHALAEELAGRGELAGARRAIDEALRHIGMARRMAPDAPARQAAARARNDQLVASVERLVESWRARAIGTPGADSQGLTDAIGLLAQGRHLASERRYDEANHALALAERHVLEGVNRLLNNTTLDYTERPANAGEEYQLELSRQRSLAELIPLAVQDLQPRADAMALIERYAETSRALRAQAVLAFQAGDTALALNHIRNATQYVQRALAAAGLASPAPTGVAP